MDMDSLAILVKAILSLKDTTESKKQIAKELPELEMKLQSDKKSRVKIIAGLDITKSKSLIQSQLDTITNQAKSPVIKVGIDVAKNSNNIQNIVSNLQSAEKQADKTSNSLNNVKRILTSLPTTDDSFNIPIVFDDDGVNVDQTLQRMRDKLSEFGKVKIDYTLDDSGEITALKAEIVTITNEVATLNYKLSETNESFDFVGGKIKDISLGKDLIKDINSYNKELDNIINSWKEHGIYTENAKETINELKSSLSQVATADDMSSWISTYEKEIVDVNENLKEQVRLRKEIYDIEIKIASLDPKKDNSEVETGYKKQIEDLQKKLQLQKDNALVYDDIISSAKQEQYVIEQTEKSARKLAEIKILRDNKINLIEEKEIITLEKARQKADVLINRIEAFRKANPKAEKQFGKTFDEMINDLREAPLHCDEFNRKFQSLQNEIKATGKAGETFFGNLKSQAEKFSSWMTLTGVITELWHGIKQMITEVRNLNSAMSNLQKVTDETEISYSKFLKSSIQQARDLKIDLSDLVNQTAEWAKKGYGLNDAAIASKASGIYSVVGEVDNATAVQDITTVMKSYNMTVEETIDIVDKFNNISNKYSVSAADIGVILSNSISSLSIAGNTLDEAIAMGTTITEITGDASEAGNTLKVLSMRLRGASTEIEAMGESTDGMAESSSKLREKLLALTNVDGEGGFDIMADENNFKSTYEIMQGIADVWDDMSNVNQAALIEVIAGKQRGNTVSALLTNMAQANNVLNDSMASSGSAMREYKVHLESIEGKIQGFQTAFQSLSQAVVEDDFLKGVIESGTTLVNILADIIDEVGALPTLISSITAIGAFKNVGEQPNTPVYAQSHLLCA